jgi:hypothetical protein
MGEWSFSYDAVDRLTAAAAAAAFAAANNQVTFTSVNAAVNGVAYDAAGNVTYDGANSYLFSPSIFSF